MENWPERVPTSEDDKEQITEWKQGQRQKLNARKDECASTRMSQNVNAIVIEISVPGGAPYILLRRPAATAVAVNFTGPFRPLSVFVVFASRRPSLRKE